MKIENIPVYWKEGTRGIFDSGVDFEVLKKERLDQYRDDSLFKYEQIAIADPVDSRSTKYIQSFLLNMTAPDTLNNLISEWDPLPDEICDCSDKVDWTVPFSATLDDIVFFMYAKTARTKLTRLRTALNNSQEYSSNKRDKLLKLIDHHLSVHEKLGGKIFAVGRVCSGPIRFNKRVNVHWSSSYYAGIDNICLLKTPIDIKMFRDFIYVSRQSSITQIMDEEFDNLRKKIEEYNDALPAYVRNSIARPMPLRKINKENWIMLTNEFGRRFSSEKQFRTFYLDYLLTSIGDQKRFFTECRCSKPTINDSFMDYVIRFDGKYLPVEAKILVNGNEQQIKAQANKYVHNSSIILDNKGRTITGADCHFGKVLVADTSDLYMYTDSDDSLEPIYSLNDLKTADDFPKIRQVICNALK